MKIYSASTPQYLASLQSHGAHTREVCLSKSFWLGSDPRVPILPFAASVVPARRAWSAKHKIQDFGTNPE